MKKIIFLSATAFILILGACKSSSTNSDKKDSVGASQTFNLDTTKMKSGDPFYQCTMNREVISDKEGKCPKCGMDLTKMKKM